MQALFLRDSVLCGTYSPRTAGSCGEATISFLLLGCCMKLVTIRTFDNSVDAHIFRSKLESEGIRCYLFDDAMVSLNPIYNVALGGIKLKVGDEDAWRAKEIIAAVENTPVTNEAGVPVTCPNCGSTDLYIGFKSSKGIRGILSAIFSFLLFVYPVYYKSVYRCKNCGTEFKS